MTRPRRRRAELREDGRSRLWRAFSRPTRGQAVVGVLLALVGFAVVTQVRANQVDDTYAGLRQQDLIDILNGLAGTTQRAEDEIQRLESTRDDLQSDTSARQAALDQARQQAQVLSVLAGTVPVQGPGVSITISEKSGTVRVGPFVDMVQALRSSGAEAMQINDEVRVVAQTSFEDGSGGLLVDGRLLEAPFTSGRHRPARQPGQRTPVPGRAAGPVRGGRRRRADLRGGLVGRRGDRP